MGKPTTVGAPERDIVTIGFGQAARDRVGMYLSSDPVEALALGLREIYVNSLDALTETNQKNGRIRVKIDSANRTVVVQDNGPGIPIKKREDGNYSVVAAFTLPHTGSHFDGRQVSAIGTNGVGASVVNHTAKRFKVENIVKDGSALSAEFQSDRDGAKLIAEPKVFRSDKSSGVSILYTPDEAVYGEVWFSKQGLSQTLEEMMKFYPNVSLELVFDGEAQTFHFPSGLRTSDTKGYYESETLILALGLSDDPIKAFGNRLHLPDGGAFFTHFKTQLTKLVNEYSGLKLAGPQVQAIFSGYVAVFVSSPLFSNQAKTALSNKEVNPEITGALREVVETMANSSEWKNIVKRLEAEQKAEEAAERARKKVKEAMEQINAGSRKKILATDKLKDCHASGEEAWLAITEGDSAQGSLNLGRDVRTVATYPIRGKFINCLKSRTEEYLSNAEVQQIAQILGCGLFEKYDSKKLKYGRVLIAVDADQDGMNIATLLITFFYVCMPQFIKEGRLWWMRAPLYTKDGSYIFTEEEWKKVKNKSGYKRNKGLGQLKPKEVEDALFGEYKRWEQLKPLSWASFEKLITELMGKDVSQRRDLLFSKVDFERIKFL